MFGGYSNNGRIGDEAWPRLYGAIPINQLYKCTLKYFNNQHRTDETMPRLIMAFSFIPSKIKTLCDLLQSQRVFEISWKLLDTSYKLNYLGLTKSVTIHNPKNNRIFIK